jgi:hypothetical protein
LCLRLAGLVHWRMYFSPLFFPFTREGDLGMPADQGLSVVSKAIPSLSHREKLVAMLALFHPVSQHTTFFGVLAIL